MGGVSRAEVVAAVCAVAVSQWLVGVEWRRGGESFSQQRKRKANRSAGQSRAERSDEMGQSQVQRPRWRPAVIHGPHS